MVHVAFVCLIIILIRVRNYFVSIVIDVYSYFIILFSFIFFYFQLCLVQLYDWISM